MGAMTGLSPGRTPLCGMLLGEDLPGPRTLQAPWHQQAQGQLQSPGRGKDALPEY